MASVTLERNTSETQILVELNPHGTGQRNIQSGVGFLDHMLDLFTFHAGFDLRVECKGDLHIDAHHSIEDIAILLGKAFGQSLGEKRGIQRYGFCYLPMDETLCRTALDISGRAYHVFRAEFRGEKIGDFPSEMAEHFFYSFVVQSGITLHQEILYGNNDHHKAEALFKGLGRALKIAVEITGTEISSTKGVL